MATKSQTTGLARKVNRYLRIKASLKQKYEQLDKLEADILRQAKPGERIGNGVIVDNFADKNKVFRSHGLNRYEIQQAV